MIRKHLMELEPLTFDFKQTPEDFIVDEIPHANFHMSGNYLVLQIKKINLTTWDMVGIFAEFLNIPIRDIGYAGLKDKNATTTQYISLNRYHAKALEKFYHKDITILDQVLHNRSIQMGDLEGNRFSINLFGVDQITAGKIEKRARKIEKNGFANHFGYQRFGKDEESLEQAKAVVHGDLYIEDTRLKKFLISLYQSHFFNAWLNERVELSNSTNGGLFLGLDGDVVNKEGVVMGLLCGRGVKRATKSSRLIEQKYDDEFMLESGQRRPALAHAKELVLKYDQKNAKLNLSFTLPKGAYATVFLEAIANRNFKA